MDQETAQDRMRRESVKALAEEVATMVWQFRAAFRDSYGPLGSTAEEDRRMAADLALAYGKLLLHNMAASGEEGTR